MGRPRKSIQVLKDTGRFAHDRKRFAGREHQGGDVRPLGPPPDYFEAAEIAMWNEIANYCLGTLQSGDCLILELTTRLMMRQRLDPEHVSRSLASIAKVCVSSGLTQQDADEFEREMLKELIPTAAETRVLISCLSSLGMNPESRMRMRLD